MRRPERRKRKSSAKYAKDAKRGEEKTCRQKDAEVAEWEAKEQESLANSANEDEREGYVPNVVYSCGAIVHNGVLFIPYAISDYASSLATVELKTVLSQLS